MNGKTPGSIFCSRCQVTTRVLDSRGAPDNMVRRRRECPRCQARFTTYEEVYEHGKAERRAKQGRALIRELTELLGISRYGD